MKTIRKCEQDIRRKLTEIDDIIFDWMEQMDMPDGTTLSSDVHEARGRYEDTLMKFMTNMLKAIDDGLYCSECGRLITEDEVVWNHDHECFCKRCATMKMIPY